VLTVRLREEVDVPWNAAMAAFTRVDVPRWHAICANALPNFDELSPDCKGALLSLTYNRGASFSKQRNPAIRWIASGKCAPSASTWPSAGSTAFPTNSDR
jgi:hypothetical protein